MSDCERMKEGRRCACERGAQIEKLILRKQPKSFISKVAQQTLSSNNASKVLLDIFDSIPQFRQIGD